MAQTVAVTEQSEPVPVATPIKRRSAKRIMLRVLVDGMAVSSALFIASIIRFEILDRSPADKVDYGLLTVALTPLWRLNATRCSRSPTARTRAA